MDTATPPGAPGNAATGSAPLREALARPWLLVVDDEVAFMDALRFRLETRGIPTLAACRGEQAVEAIPDPCLEVVLLDLNMPGLHGLETLRLLKARRPDVEVILLTGEADLSVAARGMRRGAGDYLLKPVDFSALLESLDKARTRCREHRERLRAAEAGKLMALGALAAGVGHEINNPLQIIMQRSEWLQELVQDAAGGKADLAEMVKTAEVIQAQAARAGAITAQLLHLAHRSRSGKVESSLRELAAKVCDMLRERAAGLETELRLDIREDMPLLPLSPAELEPVLLHLARNALDAIEAARDRDAQAQTPRKEPDLVRISAEQDNGKVRLMVEDSGEGVAPEHAPHIFDPFYSTRPVGKGTGLGLTVCHSIVSALRGDVRFTPARTAGTIFLVELPLNDEAR